MRRTEQARARLIALLVFTFALVTTSANGSDFTMIDTAQLHSIVVSNAYMLEAGRQKQVAVTIIDARSREEYEQAHIFSAISIPEEDFEKSIDLLPRDKNALLVVYGNANFETSRKWANKAAAAGYANIVIYSEGFLVWKEKHMPVAPL